MDVKVIAASIDKGAEAKEVSNDVSFDIGQGVTKEHADLLGSWFGDARHPEMIQPSEFLVRPNGKVIMSSYSSGPLARMDAADVINVVKFINNLAK